MDNITHTLVGAALAEAGLKRRTPLGAATLMIGANFPDIDVAAIAFPNSVDVRRGATHGFLALALLPFVLAWLMSLYDRRVRLRRHPDAPPADFRQLVILAGLAIATHPALDFMNIYGMRWLMPFVNKWFYADGLFIVDGWMLVALLFGVIWSRRTSRPRPARIGLAAVAVYVALMLGVTSVSRAQIGRDYPGKRFMSGPAGPLAPWQREIILDDGDAYRLGTWSLFGGPATFASTALDKLEGHPDAVAARRAPEAQGFMRWARFPFYRMYRDSALTRVRIADARYTGPSGFGWASVEVRLSKSPRLP